MGCRLERDISGAFARYFCSFFTSFQMVFCLIAARKFDAVQYFDTPEELIDRRYNRPRISTLEKCSVVNALSKRDVQVNELLFSYRVVTPLF